MKLLFGENVARKLVRRSADLYPASAHVAEVGLCQTSDREIREFARSEGFFVVTSDTDFDELATTIGPPPKVVWLRRWTRPTRDAEQILRREAIRIG